MVSTKNVRPSCAEENGFTLVEILIVVVIIAILCAIGIPSFLNQQRHAADAAVQSDVHSVALEIESRLVPDADGTVLSTDGFTTEAVAAGTTREGNSTIVPLSDGVQIQVVGQEHGIYTITAYHTNGIKFTADAPLVYSSIDD